MNRSRRHAESDTPERPITFRAAEDLGAFELAQLWADRMAWPVEERSQYDELAELAVMTALATWLHRWQPVAIHGALLAGACPEAVAGALGDTVEVAFSAGVSGREFSATSLWAGNPVSPQRNSMRSLAASQR